MVKKLGLASLIFSSSSSKQVDSATSTSGAAPSSMASSSSMSASSWQWPSCKQPRTLSFRQQQEQQTAYKTMNSAYLPDSGPDSCVSNSFASVDDSLSTAASEAASGLVEANDRETVIRALRSDRLFFKAHSSLATSSSILDEAKLKVKKDSDYTTACCGSLKVDKTTAAFKGATAMSMDSSNPYRDFRASMEEMVISHGGAKDWCWMEKMLGWYLRANGKSTHGVIVGAFVDLLVAHSDTASPSSPTTASTNGSSSLSGTDEIKEEEG